MPVTTRWFDPQESIIIYEFSGQWNWDDFSAVDVPIWDLVNQAQRRIDIIIDMSPIEAFPIGLPPIMHRAGIQGEKSKVGLVVIVKLPAIAQILYGVFRRLYPKVAPHYRFTNTLDEALQLLDADRKIAL